MCRRTIAEWNAKVNFIDKHKVTVQSLFGLRTKLDPYKRLSVSIICSQINFSFNLFKSSVVISFSTCFQTITKISFKDTISNFQARGTFWKENITNYVLWNSQTNSCNLYFSTCFQKITKISFKATISNFQAQSIWINEEHFEKK